jgi:hypothetical protein
LQRALRRSRLASPHGVEYNGRRTFTDVLTKPTFVLAGARGLWALFGQYSMARRGWIDRQTSCSTEESTAFILPNLPAPAPLPSSVPVRQRLLNPYGVASPDILWHGVVWYTRADTAAKPVEVASFFTQREPLCMPPTCLSPPLVARPNYAPVGSPATDQDALSGEAYRRASGLRQLELPPSTDPPG